VLIPDGKIALGKLAQAMMYGAVTIQIRGNFDDGMQLVKEMAEQAPVTIVNSINPFRLQGQKTAAFEIVEELGARPTTTACRSAMPATSPRTGSATASTRTRPATSSRRPAVPARSLSLRRWRHRRQRPIMVGYQAAGSAPFMRGGPVEEPETVATAIRIGNPQSWDKAWIVQRESGGWFDECTDEEILAAQKLLAEKEGIFCEPASAASLAGAMRDVRSGRIPQAAPSSAP
jgi:threonine synthase